MTGLFNHLWQSSAFALMVAIAAWALRRNSPRLRYWLWLAASLKFLIPFSWIMSTGMAVKLPPDTPPLRAVTVQRMFTYFAPLPAAPPRKTPGGWALAPGAMWLGGALFMVVRWRRQWLVLRRAALRATPLSGRYPIPILTTSASIEPGVFGVFQPVLLLPAGLAETLTAAQFETILAHELNHVRYRDNLTAALHMCVEALFWFHPLVWWIGAKLIEERERDCDAVVLSRGGSPGEYARGILQVCQSYIRPSPCAAGIGGFDLRTRVREIMTWSGSLPVTLRGKMALAIALATALSVPFMIGIVRGQVCLPRRYGVVSIHHSQSSDGGWGWRAGTQRAIRISHATAVDLMLLAYEIPNYRLSGVPGWAKSETYDVEWTPAEPETEEAHTVTSSELARRSRHWQRLQAILRDRFSLVLRLETRELVYGLVRLEGAVKLHPADGQPSSMMGHAGQLTASAQPITRLATVLSGELGRPVIDETGLEGQYDFKLQWDPTDSLAGSGADAASDPVMGLPVAAALKEQLGLRLVSKKGPVQVYVVEKIERPSEN